MPNPTQITETAQTTETTKKTYFVVFEGQLIKVEAENQEEADLLITAKLSKLSNEAVKIEPKLLKTPTLTK